MNRFIGWTTICNLVIYLISVFWQFLGRLGAAWARILNRTDLGEILVMWFSVCAVLLLSYVAYRIIRLRRIHRAEAFALIWCGTWIGDLTWIHQFYVVK